MLTYNDVAPYREQDQPADEIAANLNADMRTVGDLPVAVLADYVLIRWRLLVVDPVTGDRSGPLVDLYNVLGGAARVQVGLLITQILNNRSAESIRLSSVPEYAETWFALISSPALGLADEQQAALTQITGGRRFGDVTAEQVQTVIDEHDTAVANAALRDDLLDRRARVSDALILAADELKTVGQAWAAVQAAWNGGK